ncbi:hypothetical protein C1701_17890 [Actinoalloteichus sp. AHMU CJ021]|nr:hypothetical protein C1701_17890 [Actinoalloteichus sp. AHMU CJ021]
MNHHTPAGRRAAVDAGRRWTPGGGGGGGDRRAQRRPAAPVAGVREDALRTRSAACRTPTPPLPGRARRGPSRPGAAADPGPPSRFAGGGEEEVGTRADVPVRGVGADDHGLDPSVTPGAGA